MSNSRASRVIGRRAVTAGDVMSAAVQTVSPETSFAEVARLLRQKRLSALPVVDAAGRLAGIVSEADLLVKLEKRADGMPLFGPREIEAEAKAGALTAGEAMTTPVLTIHPGMPVADVARNMLTHRIRRLPVVDERGALIGIVTRRDLLKVFVKSDDDLSDEVRNLLEDVARLYGVEDLEVRCSAGVVTLDGHVDDRGQAEVMEHIARGALGVVGVRNQLLPTDR